MTKTTQPQSGFYTRQRQTVPVARLLQRVLTPAARRHGFAETAVLADWPAIVGPMMAKRCQPIKISRGRGKSAPGTLVVMASPVMALELQHAAPQIVDRVNTYFGYRAIAKLHLIGGRVQTSPVIKPKKTIPLSDDQNEFIAETASAIESDPLRNALAALGKAVMTKAH